MTFTFSDLMVLLRDTLETASPKAVTNTVNKILPKNKQVEYHEEHGVWTFVDEHAALED